MKKIVVTLLVLCFWVVIAVPSSAAETSSQRNLYAAAKKEGKVNIYSYSSRVFKFGKSFEKRYPGIKVNGFDMDSPEIVTKILAEQQAKNYVADVIFLKDTATVVHELLSKGYVYNYVPPDIKPLVPKRYQEPLLVHHGSVDALIYNNDKMSSPPINSLWDLTTAKWRGKFIFPDPQKLSEFVEVLATLTMHPKQMEKDYGGVFGKPLKLSSGVENAGYEWILGILNNDVVILGSTNSVAKAVGLSNQTTPPVGWTAFSRLRDKNKDPNLKFEVMYDVKPVMGVSTAVVIAMVNNCTHPNAAKLLIRWMMGDEKGGQGYSPYYVLGDFPIRKDVPPPKGARSLLKLNVWASDPNYVWANGQKILDFWVSHLK